MTVKDNKKILIVEDEVIVKVLKLKFQQAGFEVDVARNGIEAMEKLQRSIPDVILLDLVLPGIDGFQVLERIHGDVRLQNIPVLVFSNLSNPAHIEKAKTLGIIGYVVKADTKLSDLVQKIITHFQ